MSVQYTDRDLIRLIQDMAGELGRTPKGKELKQQSNTFRLRFGS